MKWSLMANAITDEDRIAMASFILSADRFTNGPKVRDFEEAWSNWLGCKKSLMVSSGSTANLLLLAAVKELYGFKNGVKVLVPACTWVTNISPVIQLGFTPIFCDINLKDFSFDLSHMEKIQETHPDIKIVFTTHLIGFPAGKHSMFKDAIFLDDVCESHGCERDGVKVGADSTGATFSFYFGHHITTIEGGMVSTNNDALYNIMRMKRSHGMARESEGFEKYKDAYPQIDPQFLFITDGYNFRSSEINAVLGLSQLKRLDNIIEKRRENFRKFVSVVNGYSDSFYPLEEVPGSSSYSLPFICRPGYTKTKLRAVLKANEIEYRPIISGNLLRQPFLNGYRLEPGSNSNVEVLHQNGLFIGNNQYIGDKELELLSRCLEFFYD